MVITPQEYVKTITYSNDPIKNYLIPIEKESQEKPDLFLTSFNQLIEPIRKMQSICLYHY